MARPESPVVAGVDGSESSAGAASWAAAEAARRHAALRLVIVNDDPMRADHAQQAVDGIAAQCRAQEPQVDVSTEVDTGRPVAALLRSSAESQLMVLGARGRGGFTQALLGGVSTAVAQHASCPVVVVRKDTPATEGPVFAGIDDSPGSEQALLFAYAAAARLDAELIVMQVWQEQKLLAIPLGVSERERMQQTVERSLARQTAAVGARYPDVKTSEIARQGHPVSVLTEAAREARLLVVGHRGIGGFTGLLMGSVATGVLHHATCPVAVVRTRNEHT